MFFLSVNQGKKKINLASEDLPSPRRTSKEEKPSTTLLTVPELPSNGSNTENENTTNETENITTPSSNSNPEKSHPNTRKKSAAGSAHGEGESTLVFITWLVQEVLVCFSVMNN